MCEKFINKAIIVHNNKFDYSLVEYVNSKSKVKIICPEHGVFEQRASNHICGHGCPTCGNENGIKNKCKTSETFISEAKNIHGNNYDYSNTIYIKSDKKVNIKCLKHGEFFQLPDNHLKGKGCPRCNGKNRTTDIIKEEFIIIHGNKYDYSLVEYTKIKNKVKIICPVHGIFTQTPEEHLNGCGCPICKESNGEREIRLFLEENKIFFSPQHKFNDCRNILELPFDFYLPNHNICIEFNGIQHYKPVKYFGGIAKFKKTIFNDKIKSEYCKNKNIKLIIIKYDNDVKSILIDSLTP